MVKKNRSTSRIINVNDSVAYKKIINCTKSTKKEKISKSLCEKDKRKEYQ